MQVGSPDGLICVTRSSHQLARTVLTSSRNIGWVLGVFRPDHLGTIHVKPLRPGNVEPANLMLKFGRGEFGRTWTSSRSVRSDRAREVESSRGRLP